MKLLGLIIRDYENLISKQIFHFSDEYTINFDWNETITINKNVENEDYLDSTVIEFFEKIPGSSERRESKRGQISFNENLEIKNKLKNKYSKEKRISKHFIIKSVVDKYLKNIENLDNY